jgi:hypothetical protein
MDQMMGNLFYRGVQPSEIENMPFWKMKYWNKWHEAMAETDRKAAEAMRNSGK